VRSESCNVDDDLSKCVNGLAALRHVTKGRLCATPHDDNRAEALELPLIALTE
jgi:hypothetical protein